MSDELERVADALEAEWYGAAPPRPREKWDGIVRGPEGFVFVCSVCEKPVTVPHDTTQCEPSC